MYICSHNVAAGRIQDDTTRNARNKLHPFFENSTDVFETRLRMFNSEILADLGEFEFCIEK
jgi:hypothetical protein